MAQLHIITPVKDSLELTLQTVNSVLNSNISTPFKYTIYNDFSSPENSASLLEASQKMGFSLVNLQDITQNPSPNYRLTLQLAQEEAIKESAALLIIESDVIVKEDTIQRLYDAAQKAPSCAIAAAVTVDQNGEINYPYLYAKKLKGECVATKRHCSFCCSLLTNQFLNRYDFKELDPTKSWYDVFISKKANKLGFKNYLLLSLPVWHRPHASRPWKQLKYVSPIKYYWYKLIKKRDRI